MQLTQADIQVQLDRRRPGQSKITTQRNEKDQAIILSGIEVRRNQCGAKECSAAAKDAMMEGNVQPTAA